MWNLPLELSHHHLILPPLTYNNLLIVILILIIAKSGVRKVHAWLKIYRPNISQQTNGLESSPLFHLAIVILVQTQINWNMFDLAIWTLNYLIVDMLRKVIANIRFERQTLLGAYSYEVKLTHLLSNTKLVSFLTFVLALSALLFQMSQFLGVTMHMINLLIFPLLMLCLETIFLFITTVLVQNNLLRYYNQNIDQFDPIYKTELIQQIASSSIRVWHFFAICRLFFLTELTNHVSMGLLNYMWLFSVIKALFTSMRTLVTSIGKYRQHNKLILRFDRLFASVDSAPEQTCTICLSELLNCRRLSSCGHLFHSKCILEWIHKKNQCPICRAPIKVP